MDNEVLVLVQLRQTLRQLTQGYELDPDVGDLVLVWLAHVEHVYVLFVVQLLLELVHGYLRYAVVLFRGALLWDPAELLVVDQLGDRRVLTADGAFRVLAEFHLAQAHAQRVVEHETSDERLADPEYELDGLGSLDGADGARQYSKYPALGAARDEAGRRRLGIEAAVARAFLGVEHTRLALEAEDRAVDVGLVQEDARVVHQVTGREVVRAVDDHVVILEDL